MLQRFFERTVKPGGQQGGGLDDGSHDSNVSGYLFFPQARKGSLDFLLEAGYQFAVGSTLHLTRYATRLIS